MAACLINGLEAPVQPTPLLSLTNARRRGVRSQILPLCDDHAAVRFIQAFRFAGFAKYSSAPPPLVTSDDGRCTPVPSQSQRNVHTRSRDGPHSSGRAL